MSNHVLFFVGALLAIPCLASNGNMAGSGTAEDPWQVADYEDLKAVGAGCYAADNSGSIKNAFYNNLPPQKNVKPNSVALKSVNNLMLYGSLRNMSAKLTLSRSGLTLIKVYNMNGRLQFLCAKKSRPCELNPKSWTQLSGFTSCRTAF